MKIGVVIVNYNRGKLVVELLKCIERYEILSKIIVVDSASTDDSLYLINEYNMYSIFKYSMLIY